MPPKLIHTKSSPLQTCSFRHQLNFSLKHSATLQLLPEDYSLRFLPISTSSYTFIQLSEDRGENEIVERTKMPKLRTAAKKPGTKAISRKSRTHLRKLCTEVISRKSLTQVHIKSVSHNVPKKPFKEVPNMSTITTSITRATP